MKSAWERSFLRAEESLRLKRSKLAQEALNKEVQRGFSVRIIAIAKTGE